MQDETGTNGIIGKEVKEVGTTEIKGIKETVKPGDGEPGRITIFRKTGKQPITRKKFRSHIPPASNYTVTRPARPEIDEVNLEISPLKGKEAPDVLFKYSFQVNCLPRGLRLEEDATGSSKYMEQRIKEIKESGLPEKKIEESRLGVVDTGLPMGEYRFCQAGIDVFFQLLQAGYKIVDVYRKIEKKAHGNKIAKPKYVAYLLLSKRGQRMILEKETFAGFKEIMKKTMSAFPWDNRRLPQNNVVLNFPYEHINRENPSIKVPAKQKFVIKN